PQRLRGLAAGARRSYTVGVEVYGRCEIEASEEAARLLELLLPVLRERAPEVLEAWPLARYMSCLDRYSETAGLGYSSRAVKKACADIRAMAGESGLELYHRALLLTLIMRAAGELPRRDVPDEIRALFAENFGRIIGDIESSTGQAGSCLYSLSSFRKDLAICTLRLIPAGAAKVHVNRLPRRMFVAGGPRAAVDALRFVFLERHGLAPYYEAHLHSEDTQAMQEFNEEGFVRFWLRIAELLRRNSGMRGLVGTGWIHDPAIPEISPHLAYHRIIPGSNGARHYLLGPCGPDATRDAIATSKTRRRLHEGGLYRPMDYLSIWPRSELISWADSIGQVNTRSGRSTHAAKCDSYTGGRHR
ncbi:MAG: hypothetical protein JXA87_05500, partial [Thermoleophilia bacterium]|nr:hypothetical protein [Thermoleophilia bacterium]